MPEDNPTLDQEWNRLTKALASCLGDLDAREYLIISSRAINHYVQFAMDRDGSIRAEAAGTQGPSECAGRVAEFLHRLRGSRRPARGTQLQGLRPEPDQRSVPDLGTRTSPIPARTSPDHLAADLPGHLADDAELPDAADSVPPLNGHLAADRRGMGAGIPGAPEPIEHRRQLFGKPSAPFLPELVEPLPVVAEGAGQVVEPEMP